MNNEYAVDKFEGYVTLFCDSNNHVHRVVICRLTNDRVNIRSLEFAHIRNTLLIKTASRGCKYDTIINVQF